MVRLENILALVLSIQASFSIISMSPIASALDFGTPTPSQEPYPGLFVFLNKCAKRITPNCGKEIFKSVFEDGVPTSFCCTELVRMGKGCHNKMVEYIAHGPQFQSHFHEYLARGGDVYRSCNTAAVPPAL